MVVALIALVIDCAGTATAATVLIHSSSQIANGVITAQNIHATTITGKQIKNGSIGANQLANNSIATDKLTAGALKSLTSGGKGSSSTTSTSSTTDNTGIGSAMEWDRESGPSSGSGEQTVMTATGLTPGVYAIFAETNVSDTNSAGNPFETEPTVTADCQINTDSDVAYGSTVIGGSYFAGTGNVNMEITHTFSGTGTITMQCSSAQSSWTAAGSSIIAIRLSSAPKVAVTS